MEKVDFKSERNYVTDKVKSMYFIPVREGIQRSSHKDANNSYFKGDDLGLLTSMYYFELNPLKIP